jgi:spore coat polysaccharide biosynthesis protein SpsF
MKVVAIIQARMGSTRLPGKVLRDIAGKPMLWHVIERVKRCKTIDQIVVATTVKEEDKQVIELARNCGVETFAGSEDDVLDRYYQAAKRFKADIVVRITSDCPLVDPVIVDKVVGYYTDNIEKIDYVNTAPSFPEGVDTEVFSFNALETAWRDAKKRYEREHISIYMHENPAIFRLDTIENDEDLSHIRFTVDRMEDLTAVKEIFRYLYKDGNVFYMQDILTLLEEKPEIMEINKNALRNEGFLMSLDKEGIDISEPESSLKGFVDKYVKKQEKVKE